MTSLGHKVTGQASPRAAGQQNKIGPTLPFDQPQTMELSRVRALFLDRFFENWKGPELLTALDVGTGAGCFAGYLDERHHLRVTASDVRASNVDAARNRYPNVQFFVADVEDPRITTRGPFDIVTAMGLLYHLENPFRALRNLAAMARHVLVIESVIAPGRDARAWFLDEFDGEDQAVNYVAWHLTEAGIVKLLYRAGMPNVYRARLRPAHIEFRGGVLRRKTRVLVIASRAPLPSQHFVRFSEPTYCLDRAYYLRLVGRIMLRPFLQWRRVAASTTGPSVVVPAVNDDSRQSPRGQVVRQSVKSAALDERDA